MKDYQTFTASDFAQDPDFFEWVKYPGRNPSVNEFWLGWLQSNPHKKGEVEEARVIILSIIREKQFKVEAPKQSALWGRIQETISTTEKKSKIMPLWRPWYQRAALILVVALSGWLFWHLNTPVRDDTKERFGLLLEKHVNNSKVPKTIILSDGTSIVLQPGSQIEYPRTFAVDLRKVYLMGEAFFEVHRDANKPFMVHTNGIVTRVLGTSFIVRGYHDSGDVLVQVKSGKVSVFKEKDGNAKVVNEPVEGVVVMPNQQVIYQRMEGKMTKSLVKNPELLLPIAKQDFKFFNTPVSDVFSMIEEAYGVTIVYDEEIFSHCYLNASLNDVPLYDKLKLICKGIGASYEIMDSYIIIYGKRCNK